MNKRTLPYSSAYTSLPFLCLLISRHTHTNILTPYTLASLPLYHVSAVFIASFSVLYLIPFNRNSTSPFFSSPPDTYWGQFDEVSRYNVHLNILERLWAAWYAYLQNDVLATGIMSFAMHEIVYFGRSIPWAIIDRIPYFNKFKIQNVCYLILRIQSRRPDH